MKEFATKFYKSQAWKKTREAYALSKAGLCEICLTQGRFVPGEIVHHRTHLTPENIDNPEITLGWSNLQLVCRECHARIHQEKTGRYMFDEAGRVIVL